MNRAIHSLLALPLLSLLTAESLEATVRKCAVAEFDFTTLVVFVDGVKMGEFPLEIVDGNWVDVPEAPLGGIPPDDIATSNTECVEVYDPERRALVGRRAIVVQTKTRVSRMSTGMEAALLALVPRQEAYRATRGTYAPTTVQLAAFEERDHVGDFTIQMAAVATGWSARLDFNGRSCHLAVGTAPPAPGARAGEVLCTGSGNAPESR